MAEDIKQAVKSFILTEFLPQPLSEGELDALVGEAISATGASSARDLGRVMGWLSPRTRGRADGKRLSEIVAQSLARTDIAGHDGDGHRTG